MRIQARMSLPLSLFFLHGGLPESILWAELFGWIDREARELVSELEFVWDQVNSNNNKDSNTTNNNGDPLSSSLSSSSSFQPVAQSLTTSFPAAALAVPQISSTEDNQDNPPMRDLSPSSHNDDDDDDENEEGEERFDDALEVSYDTINNVPAEAPPISAATQDVESHERNWRQRVEKAFGKMTTEIAALRERIENNQRLYDSIGSNRGRSKTIWTWMKWLFGIVVKHLMFDALVLFVMLFWLRKRGVKLGQVRHLLKGILMDQ